MLWENEQTNISAHLFYSRHEAFVCLRYVRTYIYVHTIKYYYIRHVSGVTSGGSLISYYFVCDEQNLWRFVLGWFSVRVGRSRGMSVPKRPESLFFSF